MAGCSLAGPRIADGDAALGADPSSQGRQQHRVFARLPRRTARRRRRAAAQRPVTANGTGPARSISSVSAPSSTAARAAKGATSGTGRASGRQPSQRVDAAERQQCPSTFWTLHQDGGHRRLLLVAQTVRTDLGLVEDRDDRHEEPRSGERVEYLLGTD